METKTTIKLDPSIRRAVAERIVYESHPGFSSPPTPYATTDGHQIRYEEMSQAWSPWPDGTRTAGVRNFVDTTANDFSPLPEGRDGWVAAAGDAWEIWESGYKAATPDWADADHPARPPDYQYVLEWARDNRPDEVAAIEKEQEEMAVDFAESELADAVVIGWDEDGYLPVERIYGDV